MARGKKKNKGMAEGEAQKNERHSETQEKK